jgi:hypothetical protein
MDRRSSISLSTKDKQQESNNPNAKVVLKDASQATSYSKKKKGSAININTQSYTLNIQIKA